MMTTTRREFLALGGTLAAGAILAEEPVVRKSPLGLLLYSYGIRAKSEPRLAEPVHFLTFAATRGAAGVQLPLGTLPAQEAGSIRSMAEKLGLAIEGIVAPPRTDVDVERFAGELATVRACGADVVRMVLLGGRRYEVFDRAEQYTAFAKQADAAIRRAEPIARKEKVRLGIENHKDFRTGELTDFLKAIGSEWVGCCVDLGNNLALADDPAATIAALAPFAVTVHVKDIGLESAEDGFRMSEVPLGTGILDVPGAIRTLRRANPRIRLNLEMITRDPLSIPCLTDRYWATLGAVPAGDLARTLRLVRSDVRKTPLPVVSKLTVEERIRIEDENVRTSLAAVLA